MIQVAGEDLLRALKRFKGLAKQDLLSSDLSPDPQFWRTHAETRRTEYKKLIEIVENSGVENACVYAYNTYESLLVSTDERDLATYKGREQAIELFFQILGITPEELQVSRKNGEDYHQLSMRYSQLSTLDSTNLAQQSH